MNMKMNMSKVKQLKRKLYFILKKIEIECRSFNAQINPSPIFVLGNQKSGTSVIAALLAAATGLTVSIDLSKEWLNKRKGYILVKEGQWSFSQLIDRNRLDFSRDIVKEANLTLFFDELVQYFPNSQFVFIVRDPRTNIRSLLNRIGIPGNLKSLKNWPDKPYIPLGWEKVINGSWLGLDGDNYISMLAQRWNLMTGVYLKNKDHMVLIRYEDFIKDKIGEISKAAICLKLNPQHDISSKINVQYQQKGNSKIDAKLFFGNANLLKIETICKHNMDVLGYCQQREDL